MSWYFVGVDLGQTNDSTAIAVLERLESAGEYDGVVFAHRKVVTLRLRYLERVKRGTSYVEVGERVAAMTHSEQLAGRCTLVVDGTGVGRPVVDMIREARPDGTLLPVTITSGRSESREDGYCRVPKRDLITGIQVLLETGTLKIAGGLAEGPRLVEEMMAMQVKKTETGRDLYGSWRQAEHDDLVLATALCCWAAKKLMPRPTSDDPWLYMVREDEPAMKRRIQWETRAILDRIPAAVG